MCRVNCNHKNNEIMAPVTFTLKFCAHTVSKVGHAPVMAYLNTVALQKSLPTSLPIVEMVEISRGEHCYAHGFGSLCQDLCCCMV